MKPEVSIMQQETRALAAEGAILGGLLASPTTCLAGAAWVSYLTNQSRFPIYG